MLGIIKLNFLVYASFIVIFFVLARPTQGQTSHVVINEVQVLGATAKDEFIELYNQSSTGVNLSGWRLTKKTTSGNEYNLLTTFPDITIPAQGYLVISHADFTGSSDLTYSTSQSLASDNTLIIYSDDGNTIVDLLGWGEVSVAQGTPAANPDSGLSLSRVNTGGNNVQDFLSQAPTPGAVNVSSSTSKSKTETILSESPSPSPAKPVDNNDSENSFFRQTGQVIINELLPNPTGSDEAEWIELKNIDAQTIDLTNWTIADATRSFTLKDQELDNSLINPGGFLLLPRSLTGLALNNTGGETVSLKNSSGQLIDTISYTNTMADNLAWARSSTGEWQLTETLTPGGTNIIYLAATEEDKGQNQDTKGMESKINNSQLDLADQSDAATTEQILAGDYSQLSINELLPNPSGADEDGEWIELYNKSTKEVNLNGVKIGDSSGKTYEFKDDVLKSQGYIILERRVSGLALNNSGGDEVKLWSPAGALITQTRYFTSAAEGAAYALAENGLWDWTTSPTPGADNEFFFETENGDSVVGAATKVKPSFLSNISSLSELRQLEIGQTVTVQGQIAVLPGVFGKTFIYMVDASGGIKLYSSKSDWPALQVGDTVKVTGTLSTSQNELRLSISGKDIQILNSGTELPEPVQVTIEEINENLEGAFIQTSGTITSSKGANIYIDDGRAEVRVYIAAGTNINNPSWQIGDNIEVAGLVSETNTGYRILPRADEDIRQVENGVVAGAQTEQIFIDSQDSAGLIKYLIFGGILVLLIGFFLLNRKFKWARLPWQEKSQT